MMNRNPSKDSFLNLGRNSSSFIAADENTVDDTEGMNNNGLVRPMSKKDLFDVFNSYRALLGEDSINHEDQEKKHVFDRLYDQSKNK